MAAHGRAHERSHRHHRHQRGEDARGTVAAVEVAYHGAGQDDAGARAESLHHTPEDELACGRRERTTRSAQHEDDEPHRHRAAPTVAVADRTPEELARTEAHEVARDGQLERTLLGPQRLGHAWQRRQIEIG